MPATLEYGLRATYDTSDVVRAAADARRALEAQGEAEQDLRRIAADLERQQNTTAEGSAKVARQIARQEKAFRRLAGRLDPTIRRSNQLARVEAQVEAAFKRGSITLEQRDRLLRAATAKYSETAAEARRATKAAEEHRRATERQAAELASLRDRLDVAGAAQRRYVATLRQLDAARRAGLVNQAEHNRLLKQSAAEYQQSTSKSRALVGAVRGLVSVYGVFLGLKLAREVLTIGSAFESLEARLLSVTGSQEAAASVFAGLRDFGSNAPFSVENVTEAFVTLRNVGVRPTAETLTSFGDIAADNGRTLLDFAEAVAGAATGEMERLKAFGIVARQEGDRVRFVFRGTETVVAKSSDAIVGYLEELGRTEFTGGMERQMATLNGALSNLGDAWADLATAIFESGAGEATTQVVRALETLLRKSAEAVRRAPLGWYALRSEVEGQMSGIVTAVGEGAASVLDLVGRLVLGMTERTGALLRSPLFEVASFLAPGTLPSLNALESRLIDARAAGLSLATTSAVVRSETRELASSLSAASEGHWSEALERYGALLTETADLAAGANTEMQRTGRAAGEVEQAFAGLLAGYDREIASLRARIGLIDQGAAAESDAARAAELNAAATRLGVEVSHEYVVAIGDRLQLLDDLKAKLAELRRAEQASATLAESEAAYQRALERRAELLEEGVEALAEYDREQAIRDQLIAQGIDLASEEGRRILDLRLRTEALTAEIRDQAAAMRERLAVPEAVTSTPSADGSSGATLSPFADNASDALDVIDRELDSMLDQQLERWIEFGDDVWSNFLESALRALASSALESAISGLVGSLGGGAGGTGPAGAGVAGGGADGGLASLGGAAALALGASAWATAGVTAVIAIALMSIEEGADTAFGRLTVTAGQVTGAVLEAEGAATSQVQTALDGMAEALERIGGIFGGSVEHIGDVAIKVVDGEEVRAWVAGQRQVFESVEAAIGWAITQGLRSGEIAFSGLSPEAERALHGTAAKTIEALQDELSTALEFERARLGDTGFGLRQDWRQREELIRVGIEQGQDLTYVLRDMARAGQLSRESILGITRSIEERMSADRDAFNMELPLRKASLVALIAELEAMQAAITSRAAAIEVYGAESLIRIRGAEVIAQATDLLGRSYEAQAHAIAATSQVALLSAEEIASALTAARHALAELKPISQAELDEAIRRARAARAGVGSVSASGPNERERFDEVLGELRRRVERVDAGIDGASAEYQDFLEGLADEVERWREVRGISEAMLEEFERLSREVEREDYLDQGQERADDAEASRTAQLVRQAEAWRRFWDDFAEGARAREASAEELAEIAEARERERHVIRADLDERVEALRRSAGLSLPLVDALADLDEELRALRQAERIVAEDTGDLIDRLLDLAEIERQRSRQIYGDWLVGLERVGVVLPELTAYLRQQEIVAIRAQLAAAAADREFRDFLRDVGLSLGDIYDAFDAAAENYVRDGNTNAGRVESRAGEEWAAELDRLDEDLRRWSASLSESVLSPLERNLESLTSTYRDLMERAHRYGRNTTRATAVYWAQVEAAIRDAFEPVRDALREFDQGAPDRTAGESFDALYARFRELVETGRTDPEAARQASSLLLGELDEAARAYFGTSANAYEAFRSMARAGLESILPEDDATAQELLARYSERSAELLEEIRNLLARPPPEPPPDRVTGPAAGGGFGGPDVPDDSGVSIHFVDAPGVPDWWDEPPEWWDPIVPVGSPLDLPALPVVPGLDPHPGTPAPSIEHQLGTMVDTGGRQLETLRDLNTEHHRAATDAALQRDAQRAELVAIRDALVRLALRLDAPSSSSPPDGEELSL